jgi:Zn-dependent protease
MSDIEEEIRRQMMAERQQGGQYTYNPTPAPAQKPSTLHKWQSQGGVLGVLASILLVLAKFFAPLVALLSKIKFLVWLPKILLTGGTMLLSMWARAAIWGWWFGFGMVFLIFIHECGHAFAAKMRGIPVGIMVFIPFMGAFVATKGGRNVVEDAYIGIMGPIFGTVSGLGCLALNLVYPSDFWLVLAHWCFFINLFNLAPTAPLDGGWITPVFSPKLLLVGVVILFFIGFRNPLIWILGLLSIPRIVGGWKAKPKTDPFYQTTSADRWKYGLGYFGLAAFLALLNIWLAREAIPITPTIARLIPNFFTFFS